MILNSIQLNYRVASTEEATLIPGNRHLASLQIGSEEVKVEIVTRSDAPSKSAIMKSCAAAYGRIVRDKEVAARAKFEEKKAAAHAEQDDETEVEGDEVKDAEMALAREVLPSTEEAAEPSEPAEDSVRTISIAEAESLMSDDATPEVVLPTMMDNKSTLIDFASEHGVSVNSGDTKQDIVDKINDHFASS